MSTPDVDALTLPHMSHGRAVTTAVLNVRNAPSAKGALVGALPLGTKVSIWGVDKGWGIVMPDSKKLPVGWVSMEYLRTEGELVRRMAPDVVEYVPDSTPRMSRMRRILQSTLTMGPELRVYISFTMIFMGLARIITGSNATAANFITSQSYGALQLLLGALMLLTATQTRRFPALRRRSWSGRLAAIASATLFLALFFDVWGAPVTMASIAVTFAALVIEVRVHEC